MCLPVTVGKGHKQPSFKHCIKSLCISRTTKQASIGDIASRRTQSKMITIEAIGLFLNRKERDVKLSIFLEQLVKRCQVFFRSKC